MFRLLALLLWFPFAAFAQSFPDPVSDTVNDFAGLLSADETTEISDLLQTARTETGVHIVLATLGSQADYGGSGRFADFATAWFNAWQIGDAGRNDGILILVSHQDREMRIVLGRGYDVIWDGRAQRVIDTAMLPAFREEDYARGLKDGAVSAIERLARPFAAHEEVTETSGFAEPDRTGDLLGILFGVLMAGVFLALRFRDRITGGFLRLKNCPNCGQRGLEREDEAITAATQTTDGLTMRHTRCPSCGHDQAVRRVIPSFQRAGSNSSGGFGGGSSSGGGASGKW